MKILITGANGFVGSNLVKRLVEDEINTEVIIRSQSNINSLNDVQNKIIKYVHDGTSECMKRIFKESKPDVVCHLAGISSYDHSLDDIEPIIKSNILTFRA